MSSGPASNCGEPAFLSDRELSELVPYDAAIDVLEAALRDGVTGTDDPMRTLVTLRAGQLLLMPSQGPSYAGVKVSAVAPGNPARGLPRIQGTYVLLDAATLTTLAVLDARALTVVRTSATSALSSRYLAVDDAATLVVFGTGPQAEGHVLAHREVRPLRRIGVVGRSPERVAALLRRIDDAGLEGFAAGPQDVAGADIVCACTTARGRSLTGGCCLRTRTWSPSAHTSRTPASSTPRRCAGRRWWSRTGARPGGRRATSCSRAPRAPSTSRRSSPTCASW